MKSLSPSFLAAIVLSAFSCMDAREAAAECLYDPESDNSTITCNGNQNGNLVFADGDDHIFLIEQWASVNGDLTFSVDGSVSISNLGNINGSVASTGGSFSMFQGGNLNGRLGVVSTGSNDLEIGPWNTINGSVSMSGAVNAVRNSGYLNQGIELAGDTFNTLTQTSSGTVNGPVSISGDGTNVIDNSGTINGVVSFSGDGQSVLRNADAATINGSISFAGVSQDILINAGTLNGDLSFGLGRDILHMEGGRINGAIDLGAGDDNIRISGGVISSTLLAGAGDDYLQWSSGSLGGIDMGAGDDALHITGETDAWIQIAGGEGNDVLRWSETSLENASRLSGWESVELVGDSTFTLNGDLTLDGESAQLVIDRSAIVSMGWSNAAIGTSTGTDINVFNAGTIDLTDLQGATWTRLQIEGNYYGLGGTIRLDTWLGDSNSASDRMILSGGQAYGSTGLEIINAGGSGAYTYGDGILVIESQNGASSGAGAFHLANTVATGVFEYMLFRGTTDETSENWYLRNAISGTIIGDDDGLFSDLPDIADWAQLPAFDESGAISLVDAPDAIDLSEVADILEDLSTTETPETIDPSHPIFEIDPDDPIRPTEPDVTEPEPIEPETIDPSHPIFEIDPDDPIRPTEPDEVEPEVIEPETIDPSHPIFEIDPEDPIRPAEADVIDPETTDPDMPDVKDPDTETDDSADETDIEEGVGETDTDLDDDNLQDVVITPIIRPEIAAYTLAPLLGREMSLTTMGSFHARRGEQYARGDLFSTDDPAWARVFGVHREYSWNRSILEGSNYSIGATFDGGIWGVQIGSDLYAYETNGGGVGRFGAYYAYTHAEGDVYGNALLQEGVHLGTISMVQNSLGAYWTLVSPHGWYLDTVLQMGWIDGSSRSKRNIAADLDGFTAAASIEGGWRFDLGYGLSIEPRGQLVWQRTHLDDTSDPYSLIEFNSLDTFGSRLGLAVDKTYMLGKAEVVTSIGTNIWQAYNTTEEIAFNGLPYGFDTGYRSVEYTLNTTAAFREHAKANASVSRSQNFSGDFHRGYSLSFGLTWQW